MVGFAIPTLKRGANNHCAYGADDGLLPTGATMYMPHRHIVNLRRGRLAAGDWSAEYTGPLDGPPILKPLALRFQLPTSLRKCDFGGDLGLFRCWMAEVFPSSRRGKLAFLEIIS